MSKGRFGVLDNFGVRTLRSSWSLKAERWRGARVRNKKDRIWNHRQYENHNVQRSCYAFSRNQLLFPGGCFLARGCVFFGKFLRETLLGNLSTQRACPPLAGPSRQAARAMKKMRWRRVALSLKFQRGNSVISRHSKLPRSETAIEMIKRVIGAYVRSPQKEWNVIRFVYFSLI